MKLQQLTLESRDKLQKYFNAVKEPIADLSFTMRFIWAEPLRHNWLIINGNLCFFGFLKNRYVLWGPPLGGNEIFGTINECFTIVDNLNKDADIKALPSAIYIPSWIKEEWQEVLPENYEFSFWTQDYVYKTIDLIELSGKNYKSKRNEVNTFKKDHNVSVEQFNPKSHFKECLELIDNWKIQKSGFVTKKDEKAAIISETGAAKKLIKFSDRLDIKGVVLKVDEKVIGVSLGEELNSNMCSNIIEKTNLEFKGTSAFIFREFAKLYASHEFLNAQDDFGIEYLKNVKLSYHPVRLLKSYVLKKKIQ